ncbi:phosphonate ABC transporter, permease protein PhnE [Salibacterium salarium]|uniref:Phosphonate ABC transporter, permease protein PhnE n=1 Tax=Salibacterium salarium TaxID=284579 RepID=A0A428N521_9BACI|nr:phosphonate ABC transporter, permease protein PhnE [Salibacterium salarium]RSL33584.1 phosphonate ABC transporter, permease protein PhnE [Salibacterium salarium]
MQNAESDMTLKSKRMKRLLSLVFLGILIIMAVRYIEFSIVELISAIPKIIAFIMTDFFPPNLSDVQEYVKPVIDTLFISIIATSISSFVAMFFALMMSYKTTPHPIVRIVTRGIVTFFRSLPFLLWASMLVVILGVGPLPGVMGLILFGSAFLARVYAESIEELSPDSLEALDATGATYGQKIKHAVIPQFLPSFFSWTLFMFEINIRASAILGIVGAGGVGVLIKETMDLFQYGKTATVLLIMIIMILFVEYLTNRIRRRLI